MEHIYVRQRWRTLRKEEGRDSKRIRWRDDIRALTKAGWSTLTSDRWRMLRKKVDEGDNERLISALVEWNSLASL